MKIDVDLGPRSYPIHIEQGLLDRAAHLLRPFARNGRLAVISDEQVWRLHGDRLAASMQPVELQPIIVPSGETSKSWSVLGSVTERLLARGTERGDHILAFGGGVVGDLAGFAAAIVNRGCGLIQIPTTLLAQVDSSVGGKTGINSASGKNLIGAFHQPSLVLIDPALLKTLDGRQVRAGYAEIVKYSLIDDAEFFGWLEQNGVHVLSGGPDARQHAITTSVASKARIVAEDERETSGRRALLNLGHTFAHALEAATGFGDRLLHGEAVAIGMALAFDYSVERGLCPPEDAARVRAHLASASLPVSLGEIGLETTGAALIDHMRRDKKVQNGRLTLILARGIGGAFIEADTDVEALRRFLDREASR